MAKILNLATLVTLAIAATLFGHTTAGYTYTVGDTLGWVYPTDTTVYATWASKYKFEVGDILVFNFVTGQHSVAIATKESFDACDVANTLSFIREGPVSIPLNSTGEIYFFCTYGGHCAAGQKIAISVTASTSSPPSSPPSSEPTPSTPLPETPPPTTSSPALGPGGPAPTGSVTPPPPATSPPALGPGGPAPAGSVTAPPPSTTPPPRGPRGHAPPPTGEAPSQVSVPPSSGEDVPPTAAPPSSSATRTGLASISTIFISAAMYLFF